MYLQCHPHIARNVAKKAYNSQDGKEFMKEFVYRTHLSRSERHFEMQCTVGLTILRCPYPPLTTGTVCTE